ncbi:YcxB family protein [Olsenella sp. Marseille-P4559]|uniref:YcxB family protein n=1 Tax=Olsenella sp. Marseille-P4559 TaxID=2364795 RepID=UPI0010313A22|nr:YcxB family protein [Olsenella sp. Marseille-P4559]
MTYTYKFKIDAPTFRKALYFNAFARKRNQLVFVVAAWVGAIMLACMNVFGRLSLSNVVQICYIVVLLSVPLLVFSCERGWREYRDSGLPERDRSISISDDWMKFRISGNPDSEKVGWHNVSAIFELAQEFIIYRDADQMVVLPKSVMKNEDIPLIRSLFASKLGRCYKTRGVVARELYTAS